MWNTPVLLSTACRVGNDVVFAIDSSGSVGRENFLRELNFVRSLVYGLNMGDTRVGALQFSNNPQVEFNLNTYGKIDWIN